MVSQKEWLVARKKLLVKEKKFTKLHDELNLQRRKLPWVKIEKEYVFDIYHTYSSYERGIDLMLMAQRPGARDVWIATAKLTPGLQRMVELNPLRG